MALGLNPLSRLPLREQAHLAIRQAVVDGVLVPGSRIVEEELAERLGVSRAPLREAIRLLEQDGLIVTVPHVGSYVQQFSAKDVGEIYSFRAVMEGFAIELGGPRVTPEDIMSLRHYLDIMRSAAREQAHQQYFESDFSLHEHLVRLADHQRLFQSWFTIMIQFHASVPIAELATIPAYRELHALDREHEAIVDALAVGEVSTARQIVQQHISSVGACIVDRMKSRQQEGNSPGRSTGQESAL